MEDTDQADYLAHAEFVLDNQVFIASDSGMDHKFTFDDGVSLLILTDGQEETDRYREALTTNGGHEVQCGRCKDQFGVSRQVFPKQAKELVSNVSSEEFKKVMEKMRPMKKIVISELM